MIERTIREKKQGKQPGKRNQAVVDPFQGFDFRVTKRATLHPDRHSEREEKEHADENQDPVEIERRIASARRDKCDRAEQKKRSAIQQRACAAKILQLKSRDRRLRTYRCSRSAPQFKHRVIVEPIPRPTMF